ncbi:MAG TPA: glycosyltransferase family 2 protein [Xanthomonadaceae bacterium]|nr:glycosyltransferase family 2 protein [Xanthomonadaceae bacterium]
MWSAETSSIRAVVVTHCSAATIADCLERLLAVPEIAGIVLIDNGSDDDTVARAMPFAEKEARVTLRVDPENPGFATACNDGALDCTQPWLAFVNPDCMVDADTFARLLAHARGVPKLGVLGCVQIDADGVEDAAVRRRDPSLRKILFAGGARGALHVASDGSAVQQVDALSGALMLMTTKVFEQVGGFDAGYRLHAEDLDLCRRVRDAGYQVCIANDVRVTHLRGVSSRRRPLWVEWQKHRGLWRYFNKFEAAQTSLPMRELLWLALWAHYFIAAPRTFLRTRLQR